MSFPTYLISRIPVLLGFCDARFGHPFDPFPRYKARLLGSGRVRSVVAESLLVKYQLLIMNRSRQRAPNLSASDRVLAGWLALWVRPSRLLRSAIVLKASSLLGFHQAMCRRKYRMLFSPNRRRKPGPKGPSAELIHAVVEIKQRNPRWGCPRIAEQIALAFNVPIDKDVVRRILAHHYLPEPSSGGPSWLTLLGHMKDSLWSMDLFRCEWARLKTHWVLVVMDQYKRRIIASASMPVCLDGVALCRISTAPFEGTADCQSTSAPTTILFISFTNGKPICGSWRREKSRASPTFPCRELTLRRETARFAKRTAMKNSNSE